MTKPNSVVVDAVASSLKEVQKDHITLFQDSLKKVFTEVVTNFGFSAEVKKAFQEIEAAKLIQENNLREAQLQKIYSRLKEDKVALATVLEIDAKQQDILRRARKAATTNIVSAYNENNFDQSHTLSAELRKCHEAGLSAKQVQEYLDKHFRAIFSLTGHPTNPTTVDYTEAGYVLDVLFAKNNKASEKELKNQIAEMLKIPMSGEKKKPHEEAQETDFALINIFSAEDRLRKKMQAEIANSPYKNQIRLPQEIMEISVWTHGGDADGNDNITAEVLEDGYESLEKNFPQVTVDIRHDSKDLINAIGATLEQVGEKDFLKKSAKEQEEILAGFLNDPKKIEELKRIDLSKIKNSKNAEILKRLKVCGEHPKQTEKFIIANTEGANHALSALLLLKITQPIGETKNPEIDIVTLSESVEDLRAIHDVQKTLLENEIYLAHLKSRGRIVQMIAKSDTTRVGGSGVEYDQDRASAEAYYLREIAKEKGLDLEVRVFSGGGAALQRGGGRTDEIPNRHAKALLGFADEIGWKNPTKGPSLSTVQGHQQQQMFARECVDLTLEIAMTQNLHSALLAEKKIPSKDNPQSETARKDFCHIAIDNYQQKYFTKNAPYLNELFANSNRAGVALGNLSSRPSKRGAGVPEVGAGITFAQLSGTKENFNLFETRAITLDRTLAHGGTFAVMFLGLKEAFEASDMKDLQNLYQENKGFRDFIRNQATALYMVDFNHAWKMMAGSSRPQESEIKSLAQQFENIDKISDPKQRQIVTMAFLDNYINEVGKYIYQTFAREELQSGELKDILHRYSPQLCREMDYREKEAGFGKLCEREVIAHFNSNENEKLSKADLNVLRYSYNCCDIACNAPISMLAIQSSMERDHPHVHKVKDLEQKVDHSELHLPKCLERYEQLEKRRVAHQESRL